MQLASLITVVAFAPSVGCSCDALGVRTRVVERLVPPEPDQLLRQESHQDETLNIKSLDNNVS